MAGLAIYDLDKTITRRATYAAWLVFWARREAPWRLLLLPLSAFAALLFVLRLVDRGRLKELNQALLMGPADRTRVAAAAADFAALTLATNVRPGALQQIDADRAAGNRVVIATASYGFYAAAIGASLGIADVVATASVERDGALLPRIAGENCYAAAKRRMVEDWLAANALQDAPLQFYSDHVSDVPMFERADSAIAANPSNTLRAEARRRGWRVVDWR